MGFYRIGREREAIPQRGETYRSAVAKYLEAKGYRIDAESPIEGSFEDIVCFESPTAKVYVETKGTKISLHSRRFLEPLCAYMARFLRLPKEARFRTLFFFQEVAEGEDFRRSFRDFEAKAIADLKMECLATVQRMTTDRARRDLLDPSTVNADDFLEFVDSVDVYEGDVEDLQQATRLRDAGTAASSSSMAIAGPLASGDALRNAAVPDEVTEMLLADLLEVRRFPANIVGFPDIAPGALDVSGFDEVGFVRLEGLHRGGVQYFLSQAPSELARTQPLERIEGDLGEWLRDTDRKKWLQELALHYLGVYCCKKGLFRATSAHRFVFVPDGEEGLSVTWFPGGRKRKREVVQKKTGRGNNTFYAHRALEIAFVIQNQTLFLQLDTTWEFTSDGRHFLPGRIAGPLRREWRRGERNRGRLVDLIFWTKFLCGANEDIRIPTGEDEIQIAGTPLSFESGYGIKDDRLDLDRLLDTPHDYRFAVSSRRAAPEENPLEPWIDNRGEAGEDLDAA